MIKLYIVVLMFAFSFPVHSQAVLKFQSTCINGICFVPRNILRILKGNEEDCTGDVCEIAKEELIKLVEANNAVQKPVPQTNNQA